MAVVMERYQLTLHAENLPGSIGGGGGCFGLVGGGGGGGGQFAPYARVKITSGPLQGTVLGETEPVMGGKSPEWVKVFFLEFSSTQITNLEVTIWNYRNGKEPVWLGEANFEATSVFQSPAKTAFDQIGRSGDSKLYCHIQKSLLGPARGYFDFHLRGLDIKNVEPGPFGLGRSDPFFELAKKDADYTTGSVKWNIVYRSEQLQDTLNPYWKPCRIGLEEMCYGKLDWPLKIMVYDHNVTTDHKLIGEFETTIPDLQSRLAIKGNADREQAIGLSLEEKFKVYGLLCILKATVVEDGAES